MFSIGFFEIILIFVVAVILLKPEDWPNLLRQGGRLFKRIRIFSGVINAILVMRSFLISINIS